MDKDKKINCKFWDTFKGCLYQDKEQFNLCFPRILCIKEKFFRKKCKKQIKRIVKND